MLHHTRSVFFWGILILFVTVTVLVLLELAASFIPGPWVRTSFYIYDPIVGGWHFANQRGDYVREDFAIRGITFNAHGMRDRPRALDKAAGVTRLAVLGDSMVEALQVADHETFTRRLEALLGPTVEVLNFGMSGFGTVQQYLTYVHRVRQFKPDVVILGFLSANDMRNNVRQLEMLAPEGAGLRPYVERAGDHFRIIPTPPNLTDQHPLLLFMKKHCASCRLLWYAKAKLAQSTRVQVAASDAHPTPEPVPVYLTRLSAPPREQVFIDAWEGTEWVLQSLAQTVENDGAQFVLTALPDAVQVQPHPRAALEKEFSARLPPEYDVDYPQTRLQQFAATWGIPYLNLVPIFRDYRDQHQLQLPYFSYAHDGHWSPLGHEVAAQAVARFLLEEGFVRPGK